MSRVLCSLFALAALLLVPALGAAAPPPVHCPFVCGPYDLNGHTLKKTKGKSAVEIFQCEYYDGHLDWPWDEPWCTYDFVSTVP